jgi:hypothetical protein
MLAIAIISGRPSSTSDQLEKTSVSTYLSATYERGAMGAVNR